MSCGDGDGDSRPLQNRFNDDLVANNVGEWKLIVDGGGDGSGDDDDNIDQHYGDDDDCDGIKKSTCTTDSKVWFEKGSSLGRRQ